MKTIVISLVCLIISLMVYGQNETKIFTVDKDVNPPKFTLIENFATTLEDDNASLLENYLVRNVIYPGRAAECCREGTEIVKFTVNTSGNLTNFKVINSVCCDIDDELIRVLKTTNGMWKPAYKNGEPVATEKEVAVLFKVEECSHSELVDHFMGRASHYFTEGCKNLMEEKKPKKAIRNYNKALVYMPKDKALLSLRGMCYYELGDIASATKDWDRIVALGGTDPDDIDYDLTEMKGYSEMLEILGR